MIETTTRDDGAGLTFRTRAFVDGEFAEGERTFVTLNPATGAELTRIADCDERDVDAAVIAARRAFDGWATMKPAERTRILLRFADLLEDHGEELALLDCLEAGKPITDCREIDVPETVQCFRWYAEAIDKVFGQVAPTGPDALGLILREPVGVVAAILPWNFPALMLAWKAAPALAAGNSVIVKPAEQTSLSALRMAEIGAEAGIPPGVLNVVTGFGEAVGAPLGRHPGVDVVSFTGSTAVGREFLRYSAASNLKRVVLECGGKSPQIVMNDAAELDLAEVAREVVNAAYWNMGENCSCGSRLLVQRGIKDELLARVLALSDAWKVGDPQDADTLVGPMIEEAHLQKVLGYIDRGRRDGARVVLGGERVLDETGGWFVVPTVFDDVRGDMAIAREEIFGPVLSALQFDTEEEALALANDTEYGLAASLWTSNLDTANRLSRGVKAGTVSVNCYSEGDITTPFGGYKLSGFGGRDNGLQALDQYVELKTLWIARR